MARLKMKLRATLAIGVAMSIASPAVAQAIAVVSPPSPHQQLPESIRASFVPLGKGEPAVLYEPLNPGPKSRIALFVMHASGDYLTFSACTELSMRGYRVLCANNSSDKSGTFDDGNFDRVLAEAGVGVSFLRTYPGVEKIVLFGHSGGATIMTAYQDIAENGLRACQGAEKIHRCPASLAGLARADGVVLADANWGQAEMTLLSVDPAVTDDGDGLRLDQSLDMYDPANGYAKSGSHYSPAFVKAFETAEGIRNNRLIRRAQARLALIEAGKGNYAEDEPFIIAGASFVGNRLFSEDTALLRHSQKPWPLIHPDGSITTQIIYSVRKPEGRENPSRQMGSGALKTTVRNFLSSYAIRTTTRFGYDASSISGIDWTSTYTSPPGDVEGISVPIVTIGMTGHWEGLAAETIYDHAASRDRSIAFVEGATHFYTPCESCERPASAYGDTVKTTYDYIDSWLAKPGRFFGRP